MFALLIAAHLRRIAVEGLGILRDPAFAITTVTAVVLLVWAARLLRAGVVS